MADSQQQPQSQPLSLPEQLDAIAIVMREVHGALVDLANIQRDVFGVVTAHHKTALELIAAVKELQEMQSEKDW